MSQISQKEKHALIALCVWLLTAGLLALEIYVDIHTGVENATTEYQKNVMWWMGLFLGLFSAMSVMLFSALKRLRKITASSAVGALSVLLLIYSALIWLSFFSTMWHDYSKITIEQSVGHKAKISALESLKTATITIDSKQSSSSHVNELNRRMTREELAVKNCNHIKSDGGKNNRWRKITDCKNQHGANYEIANNELKEINHARKYNASRLDSLANLSADNELESVILMPLTLSIANSKEEGKRLQLIIASLITLIIICITNAGFYFVGQLIGDEIENKSFNNPTPSNKKRNWFEFNNQLNNKEAETQLSNAELNDNEIMAQKTGTDNESYQAVPLPTKRGFGNVLSFPVPAKSIVTLQKKISGNVTSNAKCNAALQSVSLQKKVSVTKKPLHKVKKQCVTLQCLHCNVDFETANLNQKYCCPAHKVAFHREHNPRALLNLKGDSIK